MSNGADKPEVAKWDPGFTRQIKNWVGLQRVEVADVDLGGVDAAVVALDQIRGLGQILRR